MSAVDPPIGALVEITTGKGIVRFCGTTSFAPGKWVGIELFEPKGKNDGSIQGVVYFSCKPLHGVFIRPSQVKILAAEPEQLPVNAISALLAPASPDPPHYAPELQALPPPPARQAQSNPRHRETPCSHHLAGQVPTYLDWHLRPLPRNGSRHSPSNHASLSLVNQWPTVHPPVPHCPLCVLQYHQPRPGHHLPPHDASITVPASRTTILSPFVPLTASPQPQLQSLQQSPIPEPTSLLPPAQITRSPSLANAPARASPSLAHGSGHTRAISITREPSSPITTRTAEDTELQEIRARTRVMEAKRADDSRHIRELETRLSEAESFVALRPKLQAKLNQLQTELIATRRELADAQQLAHLSDNRGIDAQEQLEMAYVG
ncbi:hypothetical protein J3R83DRAFT_6078 [Lanmaoa asiatica]|nr:hypothetical protein J3R83DRAFT_6078 [Lanmaoa asiatica]